MKYDEAGTYTLKYTAVDECGNESEQIREVIVSEVVKATVLFNDGTLIINENIKNRDADIQTHGAVVQEYAPLDADNPYVFSNGNDQLWINERSQIQYIFFGTSVKPTDMSYWFQNCSNLSYIDWTNFDGSENTSLRATFASTAITELIPPVMPNVENIRYICNKCPNLQTASFENVGATNITDTSDAFQGCYVLMEVNLKGLAGKVTDCQRMFANTSGGSDMTISTIYSDGALQFWQATSSTNMFRSCTSLVGGQGTAFDSQVTNKDWARIDNPPDEKGYFTQA